MGFAEHSSVRDMKTMYYVYLLESQKDQGWYIGYTGDLRERISEHNRRTSKSTKSRVPFKLLYYEACLNKEDAKAREKYLKTGMGRRFLRNRLKSFFEEVSNGA